jgi:hypothetical protein
VVIDAAISVALFDLSVSGRSCLRCGIVSSLPPSRVSVSCGTDWRSLSVALYRAITAVASPVSWCQVGRVGWITTLFQADYVVHGAGEAMQVIPFCEVVVNGLSAEPARGCVGCTFGHAQCLSGAPSCALTSGSFAYYVGSLSCEVWDNRTAYCVKAALVVALLALFCMKPGIRPL